MRLLLTIVLVTALAMPAGAEVVCQTKKGGVFVRSECKKRETAIILPLDAPKGAMGDAGAAAPAPVRVVDANGQPVGAYAEPGTEDNATFVVFEFGDVFFYLFANKSGLQGSDAVYHRIADCSDAALIPQDPTEFVRTGVVIGTTASFPGDPITTETLAARETAPGPGGCGSDATLPSGRCCATVVPFETSAGPATVAFEVSTFPPPLRLEP